MAWYRISENVLDAIANAINAKTGKTAPMTPVDMVSEIQSIQTGGGGGGSWTHQQYTLAEDWTTTAAGGNTQNFYNTYLSGTVGKVVIAIISNNTVTGNSKAVSVVGINDTGYSPTTSARVLFFNRSIATNVIATSHDFFLSAGSVIDIYTSNMPNGGV